jgi:hypothetical protein
MTWPSWAYRSDRASTVGYDGPNGEIILNLSAFMVRSSTRRPVELSVSRSAMIAGSIWPTLLTFSDRK